MTRPAAAGWLEASRRGLVAFAVTAGIGVGLAVVGPVLAGTRAPVGSFVRVGLVYFAAFHHAAIELDVPELEVTGVSSGPGATSLSIGVALLSVTAIGIWLLVRGGRAAADRGGGSPGARILWGAAVAPAYAVPAFLAMSLADVRASVTLGSFASGKLLISISTWEALVFPFAVAAAAGAAGGVGSALGSRSDRRSRRIAGAEAGGRRMFVLALSLSLLGLFAAGVVQPDGPAAFLTPSTARYVRAVADRPAVLAAVSHHVALAPNEAVWALVPAMGGCVGVRGSVSVDVLCYRRFPTEVATFPVPVGGDRVVPVPFGDATFGPAPPAYLLFLLVPAASVWLGGRRAAQRSGERGRAAVAVGAASGLVFAGLVGAASLASSITIGYGAAFGADGASGWVIVGPGIVAGTALALVWGVLGGGLGAGTAGIRSRSSRSSPPAARTAPR